MSGRDRDWNRRAFEDVPRNIYALSDPRTGKVRYVGCSAYTEKRLAQHLAQPATQELAIWITSLAEAGLRPAFTILETCATRTEGLERERYWISHFQAKFGIELLNGRNGGTFFPLRKLEKQAEKLRKKLDKISFRRGGFKRPHSV